MALIFMEGFDKYGPANLYSNGVASLLGAEWTTTNVNNTNSLVAPLSSTGQALQIAYNNGGTALSKTLPASYGRLIGGIRFSTTINASNNSPIAQFADSGTAQCSITVNSSTGLISLRTGNVAGTAIATSSGAVLANSTHYLEWDITFSATGAYQVWLDGVSIFSGTGNTKTTANNSANQFFVAGQVAGPTVIYDDLYLFDNTGTTNNTALLTSPRIETQFPISDGAVQFAIGASTLGNSVSRGNNNYAGNLANDMYLRPYTPTRNCTLNSISLLATVTNASVNLRPVVYADNGGTPNGGALLSAGSTVTGITSLTIVTLPLTTPVSLTAGTQYWLGWMNDIAVSNPFGSADALAQGRRATSTFASGAPATCPTMTTGQQTAVVWGNITLASPVNYYEHSQPPQGLPSYVFDANVGHEDLYNFPALSVAPTAIYAVAVKGNIAKSDTGAKTVSLRTKSGATDSAGSLAGQAPGTSFGWLTSLFPTDPNTSAAWTAANLNAAQSGFRVDS